MAQLDKALNEIKSKSSEEEKEKDRFNLFWLLLGLPPAISYFQNPCGDISKEIIKKSTKR